MLWLYTCSIGGALILGCSFMVIWRCILTGEASTTFWRSLMQTSWQLLRVDNVSQLLSLYKVLFGSVTRYVSRNLIGILAASLPTVLALTFLAPMVLDIWNRQATYVEVYPPGAGAELVRLVASPVEHAERALYQFEPNGVGKLRMGASVIELGRLVKRHGICWSDTYCGIFDLLIFHVHQTVEHIDAIPPYVVVRPSYVDINLLWPFLSDLELSFFATFCLATFGTYLFIRKRL